MSQEAAQTELDPFQPEGPRAAPSIKHSGLLTKMLQQQMHPRFTDKHTLISYMKYMHAQTPCHKHTAPFL